MLVVVFRAAACFLISLCVLLCWEYLYLTRWKGRSPPLLLGGIPLGALLVYKVSSFVGALALFLSMDAVLPPIRSEGAVWLFLATTGLSGLWLGSILLQVAQNSLRKGLGLAARPIRWVRWIR
jgi:FtsH-binding integral membrane protein